VKDRLSRGLVGAASATGLGPALAGAPWWAVALMVLITMGMTYAVVCWLATHPIKGNVETWLIRVRAASEPEEKTEPKTTKRKRWRWRKPPDDS
jgi:hypothetical protein